MGLVNIAQNRLISGLSRAHAAFFAERERWILWLPVPLACGIAVYFALKNEPPLWAGLAFLLVAVAGCRAFWQSGWRFVFLPLVFVAIGFCAGQWRTQDVMTPMLSREAGPVVIEGTVTEVDAMPRALRLTLSSPRLVDGHLRGGDAMPANIRVRLKAKDPAAPHSGDTVRLRAMLLPLSAPVLPGAFDFQRHAFFQSLGGTGYAIGDVEMVATAQGAAGFFDNLRRAIRERMEAAMQDRDMAELTAAFMIGETKGIQEKTWDTVRRAGIAHLMAISGFHITVVTAAVFFFLRGLLALWPYAALHWPIKKIAAVFAMAGAVFYLLLIGSPITAERSVVTACIVMLAVIFDRDPFSLRLAAVAALVLLVLEPEALQGPSFQMSFAAVVALIAFYEGAARKWLQPDHQRGFAGRVWVYFVASLATTVVASIATAPYTLYHFGQVPLLAGLAGNMVAVPVSSLITLPAAILGCLLMPLHLEYWPLWLVEKSMQVIMYVAAAVANWPHAILRVNSFSPLWLSLLTVGALWCCIWRQRWRWLGLLPVVAAISGAALLSARPDVFLADGGRLVGLRDDQGRIWLSSLRREKFVGQSWLEREGGHVQNRAAGDWDDAAAAGVLSCDSRACLWRRGDGMTVSFVKTPEAVVLDCDVADVFVAADDRLPASLCPQKRRRMIDRDDLFYRGAHAVYLDDGKVEITRVGDSRGDRPWVPGRRYKPKSGNQ